MRLIRRNVCVQFLIVFCLMYVFTAYATKGDEKKTEASKDKDVLIIGCANGYPPLSLLKSRDKLDGLLIDFWTSWAQKTSSKIEFKGTDWEETLIGLKSGGIDIHSGLFKTKEREKWMEFSLPFYGVKSGVFYSVKEGEINSLKDLAGKRVGVVEGTVQADYLAQNCPKANIIEFKDSDVMISSAGYGWLQAFIDELPTAYAMLVRIGKEDEFKQVRGVEFTNKLYAAVLKSNSKLIKRINDGIKAFSPQELKDIEKRWISSKNVGDFRIYTGELKLSDKEQKWLREHPEIRLGMGSAWPPFQYIGRGGAFQGMAPDFVDIISEKLGLNLNNAFYLPWTELIAKGKSRELDVLACVGKTSDREKYMNFSEPYLSFPMVILIRENGPAVQKIDDLYGKEVAVLRGLAAHEDLETKHPKLRLKPVDSTLEGLVAVKHGNVDAYIDNLATISHIIQTHQIKDLKVACSYKNNDLSFAVRKDWPELVNILNKALKSISDEEKDIIRRKGFVLKPQNVIPSKQNRIVTGKRLCIISLVILLPVIAILGWGLRHNIKRADYFQALIENSEELVVTFNKSGKIYYCNRLFIKTLDYKYKHVIGKPITDFFVSDGITQLKEILENAGTEKNKEPVEFRHKLLDGLGNAIEMESKCVDMTADEAAGTFVLFSTETS